MQKISKKSHSVTRMRSPKETESAFSSPSLFAKHLFKGLLATLGIGTVLILLSALAAYFSPDPDRLIAPLGLTSVGITAFLGGAIASRLHGGGALICGLLNGSLLLVLMLPAALCFREYATAYSAGVSSLLHLGVPMLSILGGYVGIKKKKNRKRKSR